MATPRETEYQGVQIPHNSELAKLREEITAGLPKDRNKAAPARGDRATGAGKGKKGRLTADGQFVPTDTIVENVRELLSDSWPDGDIRRALVKKFGGSAKSFGKHIALARKRNLEQIARSPQEAKSDAMQQWQKLLVEAKLEKKRTYANLQNAQHELNRFRQHIRDNPPSADEMLSVMSTINHKASEIATCEEAYASARHHVDKYQGKIDNMLGNNAPIKIEQDITAEQRMEISHPKEPLTMAENDKALQELVEKMRGQLAGPSEN